MERTMRFKHRRQAGQLLARRLAAYGGRQDVLVLALPRGGVPVAFPVAQALAAPLDVLMVRKLGVPGQKESAMGAIASGGICVLQPGLLRGLGIPEQLVAALAQRELRELAQREQLYRASRPMLDVRDQVVILVDDGMATGATMQAAVEVVRNQRPARVVVAVPVAAPATLEALRPQVDELIFLLAPARFEAVEKWYDNFDQTSDAQVQQLLDEAQRQVASTPRNAPGSPGTTTAVREQAS